MGMKRAKNNKVDELKKNAALGDAAALEELLRRADESGDNDEVTACVDAFDVAGTMYAIGMPGKTLEEDWWNFKAVVGKSRLLDEYVRDRQEAESLLARLRFDAKVLEQLASSGSSVASQAQEELSVMPNLIGMEEERLKRVTAEAQFCTDWIEAAKPMLAERFRVLSEDTLDDLIEAVGFTLDEMEEDDDEDEECCPDCGSTDVEEIDGEDECCGCGQCDGEHGCCRSCGCR